MTPDIPIDSIEFHNAHAEARSDGSYQIARYPEAVRHQLNDRARMLGMDSCGAEIRFVSAAPSLRVTLSCENFGTEISIYRGSFEIGRHRLSVGIPTPLLLDTPEAFSRSQADVLHSGGFAPDVWRIVFGRGNCSLHRIDSFGADIRVPTAEETPRIHWLAYGSSITHSSLEGYPFHAARLLHCNVYGKGLSGSCHADAAAADYLAEFAAEKKVDVITAELGVNMRGSFTNEVFSKRAHNLVARLREANPQTPIALITCFTNNQHYTNHPGNESAERQAAFDNTLRTLVADAQDPKLHLFEGTEILNDYTLLSADLLHPTRSGQALMAHNLAQKLQPLLKS
ncbi:SGNH/GDSL hydrolase family protein [Coraliomargarita sp. SDUM461003]|uniref:SGNH/GDSL hydrolase family protein n=1 Tax=Thalassobacterium maritimum TaxID=3041265 RepID=A0ABU1AWP1_9BACT|nr:GDSL-type esterase/lipase family protein [Coraliomargarita sp. SDUM461003]MDQ8208575.1 SGNH/GDSL hydrolase family protein [Coraliomargarita sp. SDUM461003]